MKKSNKLAWTWNIKKDCLAEYIKMHQHPWKEILIEHEKAGIKNYSIFQNGCQFFYCFECDDIAKAFDYINKSEICSQWNKITSKMVEGSFDFNEPSTIHALEEIFYLE